MLVGIDGVLLPCSFAWGGLPERGKPSDSLTDETGGVYQVLGHREFQTREGGILTALKHFVKEKHTW
jgi:hypothetical protein